MIEVINSLQRPAIGDEASKSRPGEGSGSSAVVLEAGEPIPMKSPLDGLIALVLDSVTSVHTKRAYKRALVEFLTWLGSRPDSPLTKATVQRYRAELEGCRFAPSSINIHLSAVRKLVLEAADNGLMPVELAAGIARVKGARRLGQRLGTWLSREYAEQLLALPDVSTLKGKRDKAVLAVLLGSGLRREEAGRLSVGNLQFCEGRWVLANVLGKGGRVRTVPIALWTKEAIDNWTDAAGISEGRIFRAIDKSGRVVRASLSAQAVFLIVKRYAGVLGVNLAPHDCRRSFARLAHKGNAPLEQIRLSLGHASMVTTELYLGVQQDLADAPCDHLGLNPAIDG